MILTTITPEKSKEIPGYSGFYRADRSGQIWTCRLRGGDGSTQNRCGPWKKVTGVPNFDGHLVVCLRMDGKQKYPFVHKLVLETFVGPCPAGKVSRHFPDRDPRNNRLLNLQWGTPKENTRDREFHGTDQRGEEAPLAKLTWKKVREIRGLYLTGLYSCRQLGVRYGVSSGTVSHIITGRTWKE